MKKKGLQEQNNKELRVTSKKNNIVAMCNRKQHIQAETVYHIPRCNRQKITYRYINKIYCLRIAFRYQPWTTNDV